MNYHDLLAHYIRPIDIANALGVSRQMVDAWKDRRIPSRHQLKAERITDGKLKADTQAHEEAEEFAALLKVRPERKAARA